MQGIFHSDSPKKLKYDFTEITPFYHTTVDSNRTNVMLVFGKFLNHISTILINQDIWRERKEDPETHF